MKGLGCSLALLGALCCTGVAQAESIIAQGSTQHDYKVEVEPHALLAPFWPPRGSSDIGVGAGLLFGINLAPAGFLPQVNDSVALGVGVDFVHYFGGAVVAAECAAYQGSGPTRICVRTRGGSGVSNYLYLPVTLQWNFYLTDRWSVLGEPGIATYLGLPEAGAPLVAGILPVFSAGARYHFSDNMMLMMRLGYPSTSVGLSVRF